MPYVVVPLNDGNDGVVIGTRRSPSVNVEDEHNKMNKHKAIWMCNFGTLILTEHRQRYGVQLLEGTAEQKLWLL